MPFFKDLKIVILSTGKAISYAVGVLAELAVEAEKAMSDRDKRSAIERLEEEIECGSFSSAAHEAEKKKTLVAKYDELISVVGAHESGVLAKKSVLMIEIGSLEQQRHSLLKEYHPSGVLRRSVSTYDGKRHGVCEYRYENGALKTQANFKDGILHGAFRNYYDDGSLRFKADFACGDVACACFVMREGAEVITVKRDDRIGGLIEVNIRLWNGVGLGRVYWSSGKIRGKILFAVQAFFNVKAHLSFYRARKGCSEHADYLELMGLLGTAVMPSGDNLVGLDA
ncbi:MORN repeat variant [compost metagenome]